jgi:hypothetical protein
VLPAQTAPQVTTHFTARVRLTRKPCEMVVASPLIPPSGSVVEAADIYRVYFHGPAYRVIERAWRDGNRMVGLFAGGLGNNHHPAAQPTLMAPRLIELCFQTAGLWQLGVQPDGTPSARGSDSRMASTGFGQWSVIRGSDSLSSSRQL